MKLICQKLEKGEMKMCDEITKRIAAQEDGPDPDEFFWKGIETLSEEEYMKIIGSGKLPSGRRVRNVDWNFYVEMVEKGGGSECFA